MWEDESHHRSHVGGWYEPFKKIRQLKLILVANSGRDDAKDSEL